MRHYQIALDDEAAAYVEAELAAGRAASADEVICRALDIAESEDDAASWKLWELRRMLAEADAEADRGEFSTRTVDEIFEEVLAKHRETA